MSTDWAALIKDIWAPLFVTIVGYFIVSHFKKDEKTKDKLLLATEKNTSAISELTGALKYLGNDTAHRTAPIPRLEKGMTKLFNDMTEVKTDIGILKTKLEEGL